MYGLAVIVALCFYIWLAFWAAKKLSGYRESKQWKLGISIATALIFILIPTADSILGHMYFNHLCNTEAGVKAYSTVELPAEYWDVQGNPLFYANRHDQDKLRLIFTNKQTIEVPQFEYKWISSTYSDAFHIDKDILQISQRAGGKIIGQYSILRYWGGWMARNFTPHNSASTCDTKDLTGWELQLFKPAKMPR